MTKRIFTPLVGAGQAPPTNAGLESTYGEVGLSESTQLTAYLVTHHGSLLFKDTKSSAPSPSPARPAGCEIELDYERGYPVLVNRKRPVTIPATSLNPHPGMRA